MTDIEYYNQIKSYINSPITGYGCNLITTYEEFLQEKIEQDKTNCSVKLHILCKCGTKFIISFSKFKSRKHQCNECSHYYVSSYEDVKQYIEEQSQCMLLSPKEEYKNSKTSMTLQCNCGNIFNISFSEFKSKKYKECNECTIKQVGKKHRCTPEVFKKKIFELVGNEYTLLTNYITSVDKVLIKHNCDKCKNYEWWVAPYNFLASGNRCPKCAGNARKNTEIFKQEVNENTNGEYTLISEYTNANTNVILRHNNIQCNCFEYKVLPCNFYNGDRCPKCSGKLKKDTQIFSKEVNKLTNGEYEVMSPYVGARKDIQIRHKICGHEYTVKPTNFLKGRRCPLCTTSHAEILINKYLIDNHINFLSEYSFNNLLGVGRNALRFDFAIFEDEEKTKLKYLIEYDGEFHFKKYFKDQNFETQQIHDKRKNDYCTEHNITLIRIPYWEKDNLTNILDKLLTIK